MKIIVGLGNPGHTYHNTRHNIGFMVIEQLARRRDMAIQHALVSPPSGRPAGVYGDYREDDETVRLLMPLTMMNESGEALRGLAVPVTDLLLVCDDVNLPVGTLRLRARGSAGGHHGLASCLDALGTEQAARLRVGVGTTALPKDLHDFVLSTFQASERTRIGRAIDQAADACETWVKSGIETAMNRYNTAGPDA